MKFAELFIEIGLKGKEATAKSLESMHSGLKSIGSASLATKTAVLGVVYGMERLTEFAASAGSDLTKFAAITGLSTQKLQELQHVGIKYDVGRDEISSTISALQKLQTEFRITGQMPAGAALLGLNLGQGDAFDVLDKLTKAAKTLKPQDAGYILRSFGLSDNVIQMLQRANFEVDRLGAHISSARELEALTKTKQGFSQFYESLQNLNMSFTSLFGPSMITELQNAFKGLVTISKAAGRVNKEFDSMKYIVGGLGVIIAAEFSPLTATAVAVGAMLADFNKFQKNPNGTDSLLGYLTNGNGVFGGIIPRIASYAEEAKQKHLFGLHPSMEPLLKYRNVNGGQSSSEINVNQHFDVSKDDAPAASMDALTRVIKSAQSQRPGVSGKF